MVVGRPLFSVLVANFNSEKYIDDCIKSVISQTYENWELIFLDDGSTDHSIEIIQNYANYESRIKIFTNDTNKGCGFTKRKCIDLCSGEICGFLDSDDLLAESALQIMIDHHSDNPNSSLIISNFYICDELLVHKQPNIYQFKDSKDFLLIGFGVNHFASFKRSCYMQTLGINTAFMLAEDRDLYLKLEEVGTVDLIDDFLYYYRLSQNSVSNNQNVYKAEYWGWMARFDACKRRGLVEEEIFSLISKLRFKNLMSGMVGQRSFRSRAQSKFKKWKGFILNAKNMLY